MLQPDWRTFPCGWIDCVPLNDLCQHDVTTMYLFYDTMVTLGIVNHDFPMVAQFSLSTNPTPSKKPSSVASNMTNDSTDRICGATKIDGQVCQCPNRNPVPDHPTALPCTCASQNNDRMCNWLHDNYGSSTFNTCPHQALPIMTGHLLKFILKTTWHQLQSIWPFLFQFTGKGKCIVICCVTSYLALSKGSIWRTSGMVPSHGGYTETQSLLNKHCQRETQFVESPFHLTRRIPRNTWKTVTDAWNGYHSMPLWESDSHLITFNTHFGRWHYKKAPQGFL